MLRFAFVLSALFVADGLQAVYAQSVSFDGGGNNASFYATFRELSDLGAQEPTLGDEPFDLDGAIAFDLFVSTGTDILYVDANITNKNGVNALGGWYNSNYDNGFGARPPNATDLEMYPYLEADSWVTTGGSILSSGQTVIVSSLVGPNTLQGGTGPADEGGPLGGAATITDDIFMGPQNDLHFARFTLIPDENGRASATFFGLLATGTQPNPTVDMFSFTLVVPEPNRFPLLFISLVCFTRHRRFERRRTTK